MKTTAEREDSRHLRDHYTLGNAAYETAWRDVHDAAAIRRYCLETFQPRTDGRHSLEALEEAQKVLAATPMGSWRDQ